MNRVTRGGSEWTRKDTLLRLGRSPYFTKYGRSRLYHADFLEAERMAMAEERGLWAGGK